MKTVKYIVIVLVILLVLLIAGGSFYTVREDEYGVVTKFGKIVAVKDTAGLGFKMPFVEQVRYVDSPSRSSSVSAAHSSPQCSSHVLFMRTA